MQKHEIELDRDYAYRDNVRAWEKSVDSPKRVHLLESLGNGRYLGKREDGSKEELASRQLVCEWTEEAVSSLLAHEKFEREFRADSARDPLTAEASQVVLDSVVSGVYIDRDRAWLSPPQEKSVLAAVGFEGDPTALSPMCHRGDEGLCLTLPATESLAVRIAERNPDGIRAAVEAEVSRMVADGYYRILPAYEPRWNKALEWAGQSAVQLPAAKPRSTEVSHDLFENLYGQGVRKEVDEDRAWLVESEQMGDVAHLLGPAASTLGDISLRRIDDQHLRLGIGWHRQAEVLNPQEIQGFALSLSEPQARMLARIRDSGEDGFGFPRQQSERRTLESLVNYDLVWESENRATEKPARIEPGRFRLSDAGWRVLEALGPRAVD